MKKLLILPILAILLFACEKEETENTCPVLGVESIPTKVMEGFKAKYPGTIVENWFDKEGTYVAGFEQNGNDRFAIFGEDGNFQSEFDGENNDDDNGCACDDEHED